MYLPLRLACYTWTKTAGERGAYTMIVTICRKYGSGGKEIGRQLALRLGVPFYDADLAPEGSEEARFGAIRALADRGPCVIVGFCADHILAGREGLIRVFIHCDMDRRVERIVHQYGLARPLAAREALRQDRERARLYGFYTGGKWADLSRYDLTVDSGPLGIAGTVELLGQFVALKVMRRRGAKEGTALF